MKLKIRNIANMAGIALMLTSGAMLQSCSDDFAQPPANYPEGGIGTGLWDNPLTSYQVQIGSVNAGLEEIWAKGYIVGAINTDIGNTLNARAAVWSGTDDGTFNTNMLISDYTPEELEELFCVDGTDTRYEHVATVQLPSGGVRDALNIQTNPSNIGRQVCIKGSVGEKYCGAYGVKSVSEYNWGDKGKQPVVLPPIDGPFWENFESSADFSTYKAQGWRNVSVKGTLSGWYIKTFDNTNYITVSAYKGSATGGPYEIWLITPEFNLDDLEHKTLEFRSQAAYQSPDSYLEVYAMTSDDPKTSVNTKLEAELATPPASGYSSWVNSGEIDLSSFTGKIRIGWKYYSAHGGDGNSTTYSLDDINVGQAEEPAGPAQPSDALYTLLNQNANSIDWTADNNLPINVSDIWSWETYSGSSYLAASAGKPGWARSYAWSPDVSLEGVQGANIEFEHAAKYQTTLRELCKFVVREVGTNNIIEYDIPSWPNAGGWTFAKSGVIDISAFDGKVVNFGFLYGASMEGADKWEIRNLKVKGNK